MHFILSDIELMYLTERKHFLGGFLPDWNKQKKKPKTKQSFSIEQTYIPERIHTLLLHTWFFVGIFATAGRTEWGRWQGYTKKMHGFVHIWMHSFGVQTRSVFKRTSGFIARSTQIFVHESRGKLKWSETNLGLLRYLQLCWLLGRLF